MSEGVHEARTEKQAVNCRGCVVGCIGLTGLQIDDFELGRVARGANQIEGLVAGLGPVVGIFDANDAPSSVLDVEDLDPVVVTHQKERELFGVVSGHAEYFEIKGIRAILWHSPGDLGRNEFLRAINHVKLVVVLDAHHELVGLVLDSARNVTVGEVNLSQAHLKVEGALLRIPLEFAEKHAVVAAEADLSLARRHNDVENGVDFQRLRLEYLAHRVDLDDVNVAEVLSKDDELLLDSVVLVFKNLNVVDALL